MDQQLIDKLIEHKNSPQKIYNSIKNFIDELIKQNPTIDEETIIDKCVNNYCQINVLNNIVMSLLYAVHDDNITITKSIIKLNTVEPLRKVCVRSICTAMNNKNMELVRILFPYAMYADQNKVSKFVFYAYENDHYEAYDLFWKNGLVQSTNLSFLTNTILNKSIDMVKVLVNNIHFVEEMKDQKYHPMYNAYRYNKMDVLKVICDSGKIPFDLKYSGYHLFGGHKHEISHHMLDYAVANSNYSLFAFLLNYYNGDPYKITKRPLHKMWHETVCEYIKKYDEVLQITTLYPPLRKIIDEYVLC